MPLPIQSMHWARLYVKLRCTDGKLRRCQSRAARITHDQITGAEGTRREAAHRRVAPFFCCLPACQGGGLYSRVAVPGMQRTDGASQIGLCEPNALCTLRVHRSWSCFRFLMETDLSHQDAAHLVRRGRSVTLAKCMR